MIDTLGMSAAQVFAEGRGASEPRCPDATPKGRRCNRWIEVKFDIPAASIKRINQEQQQAIEKTSQPATASAGKKTKPSSGRKYKPTPEVLEIKKPKRKKWWKNLFRWKKKKNEEDFEEIEDEG